MFCFPINNDYFNPFLSNLDALHIIFNPNFSVSIFTAMSNRTDYLVFYLIIEGQHSFLYQLRVLLLGVVPLHLKVCPIKHRNLPFSLSLQV